MPMSYADLTVQDIIKSRGYRKNIKGDKFSLYISNYPSNANYLSSRIGDPNLILAELCCSIGVTLEFLAPNFKKVIGVDIDKAVLDACRINLKEAGVYDNVEIIEGNICDENILGKIEADIVIYDIPYWYAHTQENKGDLLLKNPPLKDLILKLRNTLPLIL